MMQRSRQSGVPVLIVDDEVIVGFNRPRLEQLISRARSGPAGGKPRGLGLSVADAQTMSGKVPWLGGRSGAYVGRVAPASPGALAGVGAGDLIVAVDGRPIAGGADLEREVASGRPRLVLTVVNQNGTRQVAVSLT